MNAAPVLARIAKALRDCRLEAILVGNAAAALQGAPVTTLDFDFMFRKTPLNLKKLKKLAAELEMSLSQPFYPTSNLYRLVQRESGLQLDFMPELHGIASFETLRAKAIEVYFGGVAVQVADLSDIIRSKRALGRDKDLAVLDVLEKTRREKEEQSKAK
jgi:predicted nucleotidyltransferase